VSNDNSSGKLKEGTVVKFIKLPENQSVWDVESFSINDTVSQFVMVDGKLVKKEKEEKKV